MRSKAPTKKVPQRGAAGKATGLKSGENAQLRLNKRTGKPTKTPRGKGLGKAGARRLGRLLKRVIRPQEQPKGQGKVSLPKTPVRLFKHQIQTEANNAPKASSPKLASPQVSRLILSVVSKCKHRGGISMAELKQTLATEGYDVTKNNRQVNVVTKRLVNSETFVRTTRNASFRLNNKLTDTTRVKAKTWKSSKPKRELKQSTSAHKFLKGAERSQRGHRMTPKPRGKSRKPTGKTQRAPAKLHRQPGKTRKPAAKSHKQRRQATKPRRKAVKPVGKKRRPAKNRARRPLRKAKRSRRRQPKHDQHPYKSSRTRQPPRRRLPKTRGKSRQIRNVRRRAYY
ncbi:uncharacterized protein LOC142380595 [Odontesthes bonariensis]|uniref:uncharacterized protein LOC142380595 n=1 Tax=Odontesthes bonariensis TaxID=219752 RepID=UPI003F588CD9